MKHGSNIVFPHKVRPDGKGNPVWAFCLRKKVVYAKRMQRRMTSHSFCSCRPADQLPVFSDGGCIRRRPPAQPMRSVSPAASTYIGAYFPMNAQSIFFPPMYKKTAGHHSARRFIPIQGNISIRKKAQADDAASSPENNKSPIRRCFRTCFPAPFRILRLFYIVSPIIQ